MLSIEDLASNFEILDDWSERYRYLIELGRELDPLSPEAHNEANRVKGCASQVWLETRVACRDGEPLLSFRGDSDAHIVKGLIFLAIAFYGDRPARDIAREDAGAMFARLGLGEHLTPQRSNGFRAMVDKMRADARRAVAADVSAKGG